MKALIVFFCAIVTFGQYIPEDDPAVFGLYLDKRFQSAVWPGDKDIAKVVVTLTALDEYMEVTTYSKQLEWVGPFFTLCPHEFPAQYNLLGKYKAGTITQCVVYFMDKTKKVYDFEMCKKMTKVYLQRMADLY